MSQQRHQRVLHYSLLGQRQSPRALRGRSRRRFRATITTAAACFSLPSSHEGACASTFRWPLPGRKFLASEAPKTQLACFQPPATLPFPARRRARRHYRFSIGSHAVRHLHHATPSARADFSLPAAFFRILTGAQAPYTCLQATAPRPSFDDAGALMPDYRATSTVYLTIPPKVARRQSPRR